jgi:ABC-2 type transport system ATP-binding protein
VNTLEVRDLVKVYDRGGDAVRAVDGLSLDIAAGETLGLLGPNGAGKTTTIRTVATLVRPTSGRVAIEGVDVVQDPDGARQRLGYVPQEIALDRMLNVREHLELAGRLHRLSGHDARTRAAEILALVKLEDKARVLAKKLSGGMKKRLDLGMGLIHRPKLLVLDEPTVGLDVEARLAVWDFLQSLKARGTAILIATHSMEEATRLSDRVAVIDRGKVARVGKPADLISGLEGDVLEVSLAAGLPDDDLLAAAKGVAGIRHVSRTRDGFEVSTDKDPSIMAALLQVVASKGRAVASASYRKPTLEDVFRRAVGRGFSETEQRG